MEIRPPEFDQLATELAPYLNGLPGKVVAISGREGVGKTTLARFLAWRFNSSLIETDLFFRDGAGLEYHLPEIARIIDVRLSKPRPVFIEGVTVQKILSDIGLAADILIYVQNENYEGDGILASHLSRYDAEFRPADAADFVVKLAH